MLRKRIIPCLDLKDGRVVKGVKFIDLVSMGDPAAHALYYNNEGADELVILDITASHEARGTLTRVVEAVAENLFIPLTVGGGVRTSDDVRALRGRARPARGTPPGGGDPQGECRGDDPRGEDLPGPEVQPGPDLRAA